jgi:hypothetical protein
VGGGAGVATDLATRGAPAQLPAESIIRFRLASPVSVTEVKPGSLRRRASPDSEAAEPSSGDTEPPPAN